MEGEIIQKPAIEEWLHWADLLSDRLTDCVHIYKKPPHPDVFMSDAELQQKSEQTNALLHRIYHLTDPAQMPTDTVRKAEDAVHAHDEQLIDGIAVSFRDALQLLPIMSADMQKLLKSHWSKAFPDLRAHNLFLGPTDESQGLGSGYPEQGRLPQALAHMLEREKTGDHRQKRKIMEEIRAPERHTIDQRRRVKAVGQIE